MRDVMSKEIREIGSIVEEYFKEHHQEMVVTERIKTGIATVILTNEKIYDVSAEILKREIEIFLAKDKILDFVKDRQPYIESVPTEVEKNIINYFEQHLQRYTPVGICRKSNHPDDRSLYEVIACNGNREYACWTSWNESTQSLNYGHYGLETIEEALNVVKENFHDITDEVNKYGIECSYKSIETENTRQEVQTVDNNNSMLKNSIHRR